VRFVSVVSGCYNEEDNVRELYERVCRVFATQLTDYTFEFIIIDNASKDDSVAVAERLAASCAKTIEIMRHAKNIGPHGSFN